jgi:hypothetical protein
MSNPHFSSPRLLIVEPQWRVGFSPRGASAPLGLDKLKLAPQVSKKGDIMGNRFG